MCSYARIDVLYKENFRPHIYMIQCKLIEVGKRACTDAEDGAGEPPILTDEFEMSLTAKSKDPADRL